MPFKELKYKKNQSVIKVFGEGENRKIKVITMRNLRTSGIECDDDITADRGVNEQKLADNISRAKSIIFEYAFCNPWEYFFTGTLDKSKYNRSDLDKFHKDFTKWISNYNRLKNCQIKFCIIPELHADGKSWHFHGFIMGLPVSHLHQFQIGDVMGKKIAERVYKGYTVYNWEPYAQKFGFCDLEPIQNAEAVSKYVTKYINKELGKSVTQLGAHMYYHSRGLKRAETKKKGFLMHEIKYDFKGEFCDVAWLPYSDELLEQLCAGIVKTTY